MIKKGLALELVITDLAFGGRGVASVKNDDNEDKKDFVVFVDGALPGQTVMAKITNKKRRYAEAKMVEIIKASPDEVAHNFQPTPGAPWLGLPVDIQQQHKQSQVFELFKKFAELNVAKVFDEFISSPQQLQYRNKMDYSFGPTAESYEELPGNRGEGDIYKKWSHSGFGLGSKKRGQFWLVESLEKPSGMFDETFEVLLPELRQLCESLNNTVYNSKSNTGFWRQLVVKKSFAEDKFLLNIITNTLDCHPELDSGSLSKSLINFFNAKLPKRIKGIYWTQSDDTGNANYKYQQRDLIYGEDKLTERLSLDPGISTCLDFNISMDSFFQTNVFSAEKLYKKAASYVSDADEILELFAGTGTISQILAKQNPNAKITSVEIVPSAVKDAKANAAQNGINSVNFVCDDVNMFMKTYEGTPPVVVLDPPRAGISPKALQKIINFGPQEIVYISCNPATLARDTATLLKNCYKLEKLSLVDQFPHTAHVECVAKFVKK